LALIPVKKVFVSGDNNNCAVNSVKLQQIDTLIAIAETGSIRAAARRLGLSQPALSKGVQSLEAELGVALVERTSVGATLTSYGRTVLARGRGIALEIDRLRADIEQLRGHRQGRVAVALSPSPALLLLPGVLERFHIRYPEVQVRLREAVYPETLRLLREQEVDLVVGAQPPGSRSRSSGYLIERLYENRLLVTGRVGHPKAGARSLSELLEEEWLVHGSIDGPGSLYAPMFQARGLPVPKPWIFSESWSTTLAIMQASDALALLPQRLVEPLERAGRITTFSLDDTLPHWDVSLITRRDPPLTPMARDLATMLRRAAPRREPV
jgi:molybdate transport repressor ModE-like protein